MHQERKSIAKNTICILYVRAKGEILLVVHSKLTMKYVMTLNKSFCTKTYVIFHKTLWKKQLRFSSFVYPSEFRQDQNVSNILQQHYCYLLQSSDKTRTCRIYFSSITVTWATAKGIGEYISAAFSLQKTVLSIETIV